MNIRMGAVVALLLALAGCTMPGASTEPEVYTYNSWETLIPESCQSFFDGCNRCTRAPGAPMAACTRMACEVYEKPECLDEK